MWPSIISFLGGPVVKGLISAYQLHLTAVNTSEATAADLAAKEIAAQTIETQSLMQLRIAEIGHPWEPEKLAFYIALFFLAKCVVWDTVLGLGTTPPLKGDVSNWCGLIISFLFR